jgi:TolB-like protein
MKRCPECRRDYYDDTLLYCLDDGTALLEGPASGDTAPTAIFGAGDGLPRFDGMTEAMAGAAVAMAPPTASIAVLPFAHMSSDPDSEYFCDGLAEELINSLARVDDLKVVARTSAFSFKGQNISISEIGSRLNVQHIVEGSVRKFGERMRITVQLINAADSYNLWSEKYDTEMRDLFDVQDEITLSVVTALKSKLLGREDKNDPQLASLIADLKHHAHDVLAYQLYLRGRYFLNKFTPDDFYRAIDCFNQALGIDENFASAYAGLAETHVLLTEFGPISSLEGLPKAKEAALKAISLDNSLSEAHASLALVLQEFDYDFARAEQEYKIALELNPNNPIAHEYYGALLAQLGRHDEAEVQCLKAIELDPLSVISGWVYPFALYLAHRYDEALAEAIRVRELDPNFSATYLILSVLHQLRSEYAESVEAYLKFLELCAMSEIADEGRQAFNAGGWEGFLRRMTADEIRIQLSAYMAAANYAALGETEAALASLEESFDRREGFIVMLKQDPRFDALRGDTRFEALLDKIGFTK